MTAARFVGWWRRAGHADRVHALVAALVVLPWLVWATVTWRTGRLGWGAGAASGYMLLWGWSAVRVERRRRRYPAKVPQQR